jgi:hypothetical protein
LVVWGNPRRSLTFKYHRSILPSVIVRIVWGDWYPKIIDQVICEQGWL